MLRTISIPNTETVFFNVPKDYIGEDLEIIAFARNEGLPSKALAKKQASFNAISIDTKKFNRDEANER